MPNSHCGALMRVLFCLQILSIAFFSVLHPGSVAHDLALRFGDPVWYVLIAMCGIGSLCLIDTIINDYLPDAFHFKFGLSNRHVLFMFLAIGYAMMMRYCVQAAMYSAIPYFLINITFIIISAFLDIQKRFKNNTKNQEGSSHA